MQLLLKPHLIRFKSYLLPLPKSLLKLYHPSFLPESFIATLSDSNKYYCQILDLHNDNYLQQLENVKKRIEYNKCRSLAEFKGFSINNDGGITQIYLYYQMGIKTFKGILKSYVSKEEAFWRIFFPLVRAMAFLEKQKVAHRNLNAYNIILTQNYEIKLLYNINQPTSIDLYYQDSETSDWEYLFLSPEQMECETNQDLQNPYKSDVFNLAAIFLVHLISSKEGQYGDSKYLEKKLYTLKQKFSYSLCNVLSKMLEIDWWERPTWLELGLVLDELEKGVEEQELDRSRLYTDIAPRMTRDLLSMVDLKETRRTGISEEGR